LHYSASATISVMSRAVAVPSTTAATSPSTPTAGTSKRGTIVSGSPNQVGSPPVATTVGSNTASSTSSNESGTGTSPSNASAAIVAAVAAAGTSVAATQAAMIAAIPRVGDITRTAALPDLIITPANGHQLAWALTHAQDGQTVRIDDGTYEIDDDITITK
jgi:hypothetical protein